jgi:hypothetical protein
MTALQRWRNADHEDTIRLTRDDVIMLIEEVTESLAKSPAVSALVKAAEARGWNNGMLTAVSHVAEARNGHDPGPLFKALNEVLGKIDDARFAAIRAQVTP